MKTFFNCMCHTMNVLKTDGFKMVFIFTEKIVGEDRRVKFIPDIVCRREEGGLSDIIRSKLRRNDLLAFDGNPGDH